MVRTARYVLPQVRRDLQRKMVFGKDLDLRYFRDTDGREVDFVVVDGKRPILLVECKWADAEVDRSLRYLKLRFPGAHAWQLSAVGTKDTRLPMAFALRRRSACSAA